MNSWFSQHMCQYCTVCIVILVYCTNQGPNVQTLHISERDPPWRIGLRHGLLLKGSRVRIPMGVSGFRTTFTSIKRFNGHPK